MAEIDKSMKLVFNEFTRAISEVPLEVFYQTINSDQYNANGFQFNIKQPGSQALLDCDIWIRYILLISDTGDAVRAIFEPGAGAAGDLGLGFPLSTERIAFRGGNCVARSIQNLMVQINNTTLNVQPYKFMDVLNRIYVSNDMSEHEFSASGGRFDEGNHGNRTEHVLIKDYTDAASNVVFANGGSQFPDGGGGDPITNGNVAANNTNFKNFTVSHGFYTAPAPAQARQLTCHMRPAYPLQYPWYNPGFSKRFDKFAIKCRSDAARAVDNFNGGTAPGANAGLRFPGMPIAANSQYYKFEIYERLPIPLFKMYSSDGNYGVIPNIVQMQIQGSFLSTLKQNILRTTNNLMTVNIRWDEIDSSSAQLYLRWYTPPMTMSIPREISIPYPKINTWSVNVPYAANSLNLNIYNEVDINQYNITLEAIPDLLLIYVKLQAVYYTLDSPDDSLFEIVNLTINIDSASGKVNQIQTIDLYQKWKKIIKHQDAKIIDYDEWRKYCCVACLQPEDYGCRYGPGYSNMTTLGIICKARNWYINPAIFAEDEEPLMGQLGAETHAELIVLSLYNKNRLTLRADGSAYQDLTKLSADFSMIPSALNPSAAPQLV